MGLRIDFKSSGNKTRIIIAGELRAGGVVELKRTLPFITDAIELDLTELTFADSDGVEAIRQLISTGETAIGASPLIKRLISV